MRYSISERKDKTLLTFSSRFEAIPFKISRSEASFIPISFRRFTFSKELKFNTLGQLSIISVFADDNELTSVTKYIYLRISLFTDAKALTFDKFK